MNAVALPVVMVIVPPAPPVVPTAFALNAPAELPMLAVVPALIVILPPDPPAVPTALAFSAALVTATDEVPDERL